ncbi:MAG: SDR family oxidoreductase [Bryobacterales bacterium]|nr:SDR family oxidoreductase [Bryobacterales bacterium]
MPPLQKSWALVTGASSGIGVEFARILASQGYPLVLVARREENLRTLAKELESAHGIATRVLVSDLSAIGAAEALWEQVREAGLEIDALINNAGFGDHGHFSQSDWERTHQMLQLNIVALTALTRFVLPSMLARKQGYILNVASTAAFQPGPGMAVYFATKSYVLSFTEALWSELQGSGVIATTLCPGPTQSEFFAAANMGGRSMAKRKLPSSREVAELGLRAMFAGKRTVVHGLANRILAASNRLVPRGAVLSVTRKMLE